MSVMELEQPELGARVRATWKGVPKRSRKILGEASGLSLGRIDSIERGGKLKDGDREGLARGLEALGWILAGAPEPGAEGQPGPPEESSTEPVDPELLERIATPGEGANAVPVVDGICEPCQGGHHNGCLLKRPHPGEHGQYECCDGNVLRGRVPWQDAAVIDEERQKQDGGDVFTVDEDDEVVTFLERIETAEVVTSPFEPTEPVLVAGDDGLFVMTNGQRADAERCKRRWYLGWYRRLSPASQNLADARATGDRVHRALARYYVADPTQRVDPREALERVIVEDWTRLLQQRARMMGVDDPEELDDPGLVERQRKFQEAAQLERIMVEGYVQWVAETGQDQGLQVIASETVLTATLEVKDSTGFTRPFKVAGLLDARTYREQDGVRAFIDHKTSGTLEHPDLHMNPQMLHYDLLEFLTAAEGEARCDGALYNILRKVKRTEKARPPFYDRIEVHHNEHDIESYRRRLVARTLEILEMRDRLDAGEHHLDVCPPTQVLGTGPGTCRHSCDFYAICSLFDDGSRAEDALQVHYVEVDPMARYGTLR